MIEVYLTDTVIRHIAGTIDEWSTRAAATTEEINGFVLHETKLIRSLKGEEVVSHTQVLIIPTQDMNQKDRIQLDGESFTRAIITIRLQRHFSIEFKELYLETTSGGREDF